MISINEKIRQVKLIAMDFDGVFTDNRVFIDENGKETVVCDRSDSLGIKILKEKRPDIKIVVISKETNNVVKARCDKLKIDCKTGVDDKLFILKKIIASESVNPEHVAYLGNDINDLECIQFAGIGVAVSDSDPRVLAVADFITSKPGGRGAIREFMDIVLG
ncbi:KdsC family phosphatase [uncultured Methanoregula sp.]|uniref:KdsC family phosphatase n=1 Tax=uncultured Methanoregula sp. TaxID=1005933 RepID=UPI00374A5252